MRLLFLLLMSPFILLSQTQIGIDIDGLVAGDTAGYSVSVSADGSTVAIGSPNNDENGDDAGQVRIFENVSNNWVQIGNTIKGEATGDHFGTSVSLSSDGSILAIGGPDNADTPEKVGHVRVFENIDDVWTQIGDDMNGQAEEFLDECGNPINARFGAYVSISKDGTILAIATPRGDKCLHPGAGYPGYIHIYKNISGVWTQIGDYINTGISFINDISVSGDGSVVAISGFGDCELGNFCFYPIGYVNVYKNISGVWTQIGSAFTGEFENLISGVSLSNNGSKIAIGGNYIRVYETIDEEWTQLGENIETENNNPHKISLSDDGTVLVCSNYINSTSTDVTRVYKNSSGSWTQLGVDINGEALDDNFGASLGLSGDGSTLAVGGPLNDDNGENAGHVRVYDLSALLSVGESNMLSVKLYPNPATNQFTLELPSNQNLQKVNIYNYLGQFIHTSDTRFVKTSHLASGLYYVGVITNKGKATKKLIVE